MKVEFVCAKCGVRYAAGPNLHGRLIRCRGCAHVQRVPVPGQAPEAAAAVAAAAAAAPAPARARRGSQVSTPPTVPIVLDTDHDAPSLRPAEPASTGRPAPARIAAGVVAALVLVGVGIYLATWAFRSSEVPEDDAEAEVAAAAEEAPRPDGTGPAPAPVAPAGPAKPAFPELGAPQNVAPGVLLHEVRLGPPWKPGALPGRSGKLWLYLPESREENPRLPCVLIAPAGSTLLTGMNLSEGDRAEHLPWVERGFAVLAYEIDGNLDHAEPTEAELIAAARGFVQARAGLVNAAVALDFLAARVPEVDPERITAVGHSSAGTLALLVAAQERRVRSCVAFAPGGYGAAGGRPEAIAQLKPKVKGIEGLLSTWNPRSSQNLSRLRRPVFLFTAEDDDVVPASETRALAEELKRALPADQLPPVLVTTPTGGHHEAMIQVGIPRAMAWLPR